MRERVPPAVALARIKAACEEPNDTNLAVAQALGAAAKVCADRYVHELPMMISGNQSDDYKCGYVDACGDLEHAIRRLIPAAFTKPPTGRPHDQPRSQPDTPVAD